MGHFVDQGRFYHQGILLVISLGLPIVSGSVIWPRDSPLHFHHHEFEEVKFEPSSQSRGLPPLSPYGDLPESSLSYPDPPSLQDHYHGNGFYQDKPQSPNSYPSHPLHPAAHPYPPYDPWAYQHPWRPAPWQPQLGYPWQPWYGKPKVKPGVKPVKDTTTAATETTTTVSTTTTPVTVTPTTTTTPENTTTPTTATTTTTTTTPATTTTTTQDATPEPTQTNSTQAPGMTTTTAITTPRPSKPVRKNPYPRPVPAYRYKAKGCRHYPNSSLRPTSDPDVYEICDNGVWIKMQCAPGTWFDPAQKVCNYAGFSSYDDNGSHGYADPHQHAHDDEAPYGGDDSYPGHHHDHQHEDCPVGETRALPHGERGYIQCVMDPRGGSLWIQRDCPHGTAFHPDTGDCENMKNAGHRAW